MIVDAGVVTFKIITDLINFLLFSHRMVALFRVLTRLFVIILKHDLEIIWIKLFEVHVIKSLFHNFCRSIALAIEIVFLCILLITHYFLNELICFMFLIPLPCWHPEFLELCSHLFFSPFYI